MCAFAGFLFLITLYLQEVRGYSALTAGLFLLPMAARHGRLRAAVRPGDRPDAAAGSRC